MPIETVAEQPVTEALVYELDFDSREWLSTPMPAVLTPRLRALCELWRGGHPTCRFAMLLNLGIGQYTLRYFPDLAALALAVDSTDQLSAQFGATVPWRLEILPESKAGLAALLPLRDLAEGAHSSH